MTRKKKSHKEINTAEYGVDSRYSSKKERQNDGKALMAARLQRMNNISADQIIKAKLLQLKLNMEEYIRKPKYENYNIFTHFLSSYIDTIYSRRNNFAKDINITPIRLSQVLNNHREPKDEFMQKLMIHSEKTYKNVCSFHKKTWYQVYFQEKIYDTMANQEIWRSDIEKKVTIRNISKDFNLQE